MLRAIGALNMKYLAAARRIARVCILLLGAFSAERIPADEARVTAASAEQANTTLAYQNFGSAIEPIAIASSEFSPPLFPTELTPAPAASVKSSSGEEAAVTAATPTSIALAKSVIVALAEPNSPAAIHEPSAPIASPPASSQWPAPARFFTINQVLAKRQQAPSGLPGTHLAAIDPKIMSDASATPASPTRSDEPFGLFTFRAPDGLLWSKWRAVETDIQAAAPALARCRAEPDRCTPAEARFVAIIKRAEVRQGRAKLELVNERVNATIHYTTDMAQWGVADLWSAPLDANGKGSFDTGFGDCEDYAIAKYVALREAGMPAENLRLLLVRDNSVRLDHAVLAAHEDGHWLILDNRWTRLIEDSDARYFTPLFALDGHGVSLFAMPYAAQQPINIGDQSFSAGANASESAARR
jgi:predicted transglutaminase-like cysteine proteinase